MDMVAETHQDEMNRELRQQTILARFGELALKSDKLDEVLNEACRLVGEALGTDLAKVMELQDDGASLLVRAGVGWKPGVVGEVKLKAVDGTSEFYALQTGSPMISPDIKLETRFSYPPFLIDNGVRAVANVVIIGGQDKPPFGILQIDSREPRRFTNGNVAFLQSYANLIAAAVDRLCSITETREREERLRLALDAGKLGCWDFEPSTGAATATPRAMQLLGYNELTKAITYNDFLHRIITSDREGITKALCEAVETGIETCLECRTQGMDDGEIRWVELRGKAAVGSLGPITHIVGVISDITSEKMAQDSIRIAQGLLENKIAQRTQELVQANTKLKTEAVERLVIEDALRQSSKMEAVGQLTGGLAHDFNNLLAGISGSLELTRSRIAEGRLADAERYIESGLTSALRAASLTHRLLAFSRRQTLDPKITDLNKMIEDMEDLLRRSVTPAIRIDLRLTGELWAPFCDRNQLENVLLNLVINARDAMPDGGSILIETANIVLPDRRSSARNSLPKKLPAGHYVALFVSDTGAGMSNATLQRAFDPFFTTKPLGQGTGLGLSMTHGFIEQSGGYVDIRSELDRGTKVSIYLPRHLPRQEDEIDDGEVKRTLPARSVILVVEDEPAVRMVVVDVLSDNGYETLEARDGHSGLTLTETKTKIDLLITDVGLPGGMNGRQLADAARQRRPDLKVLFITGYAEKALDGSGRLGSGMEIMTKPFAMNALVSKVGCMIDS